MLVFSNMFVKWGEKGQEWVKVISSKKLDDGKSQKSTFILTVEQFSAHFGYDLKVSERGGDGHDVSQHAPYSQQQEHEEVEHWPQLGQRHAHDGLAVHDEGQTWSLGCLQTATWQEGKQLFVKRFVPPLPPRLERISNNINSDRTSFSSSSRLQFSSLWEISANWAGNVVFSLVIQSVTLSSVMLSSANSKEFSSSMRVLGEEQSRINQRWFIFTEIPVSVRFLTSTNES